MRCGVCSHLPASHVLRFSRVRDVVSLTDFGPSARMYNLVTQSQTTACSPSRLSPSLAVHHNCLWVSFFMPVAKQAYSSPPDAIASSDDLLVDERKLSISPHMVFMQSTGNMEGMSLQNGENPSLECRFRPHKTVSIEVRLSKHQEQNRGASLRQTPTTYTHPTSATRENESKLVMPCRRTPTTSFVRVTITCCGVPCSAGWWLRSQLYQDF